MTVGLKAFERNRIFSEREAWMLFRLGAIAEACGWTLLIAGIGLQRYIMPGSRAPVLIAGQIHGMLFFLYAVAAAGLYPNLGWSRLRALVALLASVPPYGSLLFEMWANYQRRTTYFRNYQRCIALAQLTTYNA